MISSMTTFIPLLLPFLYISISIAIFFTELSSPCQVTVQWYKLRVFDILLYHTESYMFYLRLRTLEPYIDKHYIGFSLLSFSHAVAANLSFAPFHSEIMSFSHRWFWFNYTHPEQYGSAWSREENIRLVLLSKMEENENPRMDDLVIWSDLDEIMIPSAMQWVRTHPPPHFYRFLGSFYFYSYRWRSPEPWQWAYIMRYGSKKPDRNWFRYRIPDFAPFEYVPGISLLHCSYCFNRLGLIIEKLRSFSHEEFSRDQYIDPNYIYSYVYCGYSLFGGNYTDIPFDSMGLNFPDDPRFDYLKTKVGFDDLDDFKFDYEALKKHSPCRLPFLEDGKLPDKMPHHIK
jgi:hypothetical protein